MPKKPSAAKCWKNKESGVSVWTSRWKTLRWWHLVSTWVFIWTTNWTGLTRLQPFINIKRDRLFVFHNNFVPPQRRRSLHSKASWKSLDVSTWLMTPSSNCGKSRLSSMRKNISYTFHHKLKAVSLQNKCCSQWMAAPDSKKSARRHEYFCIYSHCLYLS